MPYQLKGKSVYKKENGKLVLVKKHSSYQKALAHFRALEINVTQRGLELKLENMKNPVILGIAATNRPHVRLREHPLSMVKIDGKEYVRVPFMVKGRYKHPTGPLDFNDEAFAQMISNHKNKVGDFAESLDMKHFPEKGSLAWFDADKGGFIKQEGNLLVGYGVPTGPETIDIVNSGKFRYASVEFQPNYQSNLEQQYLENDGDKVEFETLEPEEGINLEALVEWVEDSVALDWTAWNRKRKMMGGHAKQFGTGLKEGLISYVKRPSTTRKKYKAIGKVSKMRVAGRVGAYGLPAAAGIGYLAYHARKTGLEDYNDPITLDWTAWNKKRKAMGRGARNFGTGLKEGLSAYVSKSASDKLTKNHR